MNLLGVHDLFALSGLLDSNQRPRRPERRALPTALNPDCFLKASAKVSVFFIIPKFFAIKICGNKKKPYLCNRNRETACPETKQKMVP